MKRKHWVTFLAATCSGVSPWLFLACTPQPASQSNLDRVNGISYLEVDTVKLIIHIKVFNVLFIIFFVKEEYSSDHPVSLLLGCNSSVQNLSIRLDLNSLSLKKNKRS